MSFSLKKNLRGFFLRPYKDSHTPVDREEPEELSDCELEIVLGGMTRQKFDEYRIKLIEKYYEEIE